MKSEITSSLTIKKSCSFPLLATYIKDGPTNTFTVLFSSNFEGVVVNASSDYEIGHYSKNWVSVEENELWEILPEGFSVVLTQEFK